MKIAYVFGIILGSTILGVIGLQDLSAQEAEKKDVPATVLENPQTTTNKTVVTDKKTITIKTAAAKKIRKLEKELKNFKKKEQAKIDKLNKKTTSLEAKIKKEKAKLEASEIKLKENTVKLDAARKSFDDTVRTKQEVLDEIKNPGAKAAAEKAVADKVAAEKAAADKAAADKVAAEKVAAEKGSSTTTVAPATAPTTPAPLSGTVKADTKVETTHEAIKPVDSPKPLTGAPASATTTTPAPKDTTLRASSIKDASYIKKPKVVLNGTSA